VTKPAASGIQPAQDPNNILSKRSIYFEFDRFDVKDEYRPIVEAHAKYLRDNPGAKVLIQGNADERGSREYTSARPAPLRQRQEHDEAARRARLADGGGQPRRGEAVLREHSEDCWAKNRRDDVLYNGEY